MKRSRPFLLLLALSLPAVAALLVTQLELAADTRDRVVAEARKSIRGNQTLNDLNQAFRLVARAVKPSVVRIEVRKKAHLAHDEGLRFPEGFHFPRGIPDPLRRFFDAPEVPDSAPQRSGVGSGWVYDTEGHIITNHHVVHGAESVNVMFFDGAEFSAEIVGADPKTDIAVLKIDASNLHPAARATDPVEQGDMVFAFGSPLEYDFSMSQGLVSGTNRKMNILGPSGFENFIQTDAAINPGNSGGPLVNIRGEVVGTNTAVASRSGLFSGLGFAVPTAMVERVAGQLVDHGEVRRGYLGIAIQPGDPSLLKSFGFDGQGVVVSDVVAGLPAERAGIQRGDVVTKIDGVSVETVDVLRHKIAAVVPGEEVKITVFRDGKSINLTATLASMPHGERARASSDGGGEVDDGNAKLLKKLGILRLSTLTADRVGKLGIDKIEGVLVEKIRPGSVAAKAGLHRGVVITETQGHSVKRAKDVIEALAAADFDVGVRMTVRFGDSRRYVFLKLPNH